ncbi:4Fe-4S binding protein [Nocardioides pacificus]
MTHIVTRSCCSDAACVAACPVNCIHPAPGEDGFRSAEMVYIDPDTCIDCGACVDVCPVRAIVADYELEPVDEPFAALNRDFFAASDETSREPHSPVTPPRALAASAAQSTERLRVAVVGTGPSASYTIDALLAVRGLDPEITVLDRLLTPGGLLRHGVAPDHADTKSIAEPLGRLWRRPGVTLQLGVEVGSDVSVDELLESHHAVVLATGAPASRRLGIPGEELPGSLDAARFVGWYNGHPDHADLTPDLSHHRAVVVGNGNVALDLARLLLTDADVLRRTDIASHALESLASSRIEEVEVLGRRSPAEAACTAGELFALDRVAGLSVHVAERDLAAGLLPGLPAGSMAAVVRSKLAWLHAHAGSAPGQRRLELRFHSTPERVLGADRVEGVQVRHRLDEEPTQVEAGLLLAAVGFRSEQPASDGPGRYVVGWAKRGPSGGIGTNKWCARETVAELVADFEAGLLPAPVAPVADYAPGRTFGLADWQVLDQHERQLGRAEGRPRIKLTSHEEQRAAVRR